MGRTRPPPIGTVRRARDTNSERGSLGAILAFTNCVLEQQGGFRCAYSRAISAKGLPSACNPSVDPATPVGVLLGDLEIRLCVTKSRGAHVKLGIDAPLEFEVKRDELISNSPKD
jgi:hypothetical protein